MKKEDIELRDLLLVNESILNKIENLSDLLNDIFLYYSKFGDKLSNARLTLNSFTKFLKDCEVISSNNGNLTNRENLMGTSDSVLSPLKNSNSSKKFPNNSNIHDLKLTLKDITVLFHSLTGVKNFDFSEKIRSQFDKNKGILKDLESCYGPKIDKNPHVMSTHNIPLKMDFNLFIKSFELIALKLYPDKNLDAAVNIFLEKVIST